MALGFGGRLFVVIVIALIIILPVGTIVMGVVCPDGSIDFMDYVISLFVPGYGFIEALVCQ